AILRRGGEGGDGEDTDAAYSIEKQDLTLKKQEKTLRFKYFSLTLPTIYDNYLKLYNIKY
ncbi:MAG: hypothetical protein K2H97_04775, partial [Prevotella sp.]|nr:hypothetical protein [Prevotella sp.]